jgi:hypothetical protein
LPPVAHVAGSLATLFNVAAHRPDIRTQILEVLHALDWNPIHRNCARGVNEITTYYVLGFGHIDEQARRRVQIQQIYYPTDPGIALY